MIGGDREIGERQALCGFKAQLRGGRNATVVETGNEPIGTVADFSNVEII